MTLGQLFKQKRQESGRSLDQLAALTKIHIKILSDLEEDSYGTLPARAFTRGFIVNYAKALKLDPEVLLKEHHAFLEQKFAERSDRDKGHQGYVFEGKELEQNRRWMVIGASIAVVFAAATLLVFKPQNHKHKEQHKEFAEENADDSGEPIVNGVKGQPGTSLEATTNASPIDGASASTGTSGTTSSSSVNASSISTSTPAISLTANSSSAIVPTATTHTSPIPVASVAPVKTPAPVASVTPTSTPKATPAPTATPAPSPAEKEDKLNKGDALDAKEVKLRVSFQAKEDTWVRYKSDDKPVGTIILRKDRYLVIKAKSQILFEAPRLENLSYKTKAGYVSITEKKGEIESGGSMKAYSGDTLGSAPLPDSVPSPASH